MRFRICLLSIIMLVVIAPALAQVWVDGTDEVEYNCDLVRTLIAEYGDEPLARGVVGVPGIASLIEFFANRAPLCIRSDTSALTESPAVFKVTVKSAVNLRDCASTECEKVGATAAGDILEVLGQDGEWYQVRFDGGVAWIAGWLTTRLPDAVIEGEQAFLFEDAGCIIAPRSKRSSDMDINIIITGDRMSDVRVDLYRPDTDKPLRVEGQLDKTFIDTGDTYIYQYYYWNVWWPTGIYHIEVDMDGQVAKIAWNVTERDDYSVFVSCD